MKLALVTGASSGIGKALCYFLADRGIDLLITARSTDELQRISDDLGQKVKITPITADLSDPKQRMKVIAAIHNHVPDLVINNAGLGYYGSILTRDTDDDLRIIEVNVNALVEIAAEAARTMVSRGVKGVIMNISSSAAFQVIPGLTTYAATKAFVNLFSESFDLELRPYGIRVLASCPGVVATNFRNNASRGRANNKKDLMTMPVEKAVTEIWKQINNGQTIRVFDWKYRFLTFLSRYIAPKWVVTSLSKRIVKGLEAPQTIKKIP